MRVQEMDLGYRSDTGLAEKIEDTEKRICCPVRFVAPVLQQTGLPGYVMTAKLLMLPALLLLNLNLNPYTWNYEVP